MPGWSRRLGLFGRPARDFHHSALSRPRAVSGCGEALSYLSSFSSVTKSDRIQSGIGFSTEIVDLVRLSGCAVVPMPCLSRSTGFRFIFSPMLDVVKAHTSRDQQEHGRISLMRSLD